MNQKPIIFCSIVQIEIKNFSFQLIFYWKIISIVEIFWFAISTQLAFPFYSYFLILPYFCSCFTLRYRMPVTRYSEKWIYTFSIGNGVSLYVWRFEKFLHSNLILWDEVEISLQKKKVKIKKKYKCEKHTHSFITKV